MTSDVPGAATMVYSPLINSAFGTDVVTNVVDVVTAGGGNLFIFVVVNVGD